jgi:hypothetical protein
MSVLSRRGLGERQRTLSAHDGGGQDTPHNGILQTNVIIISPPLQFGQQQSRGRIEGQIRHVLSFVWGGLISCHNNHNEKTGCVSTLHNVATADHPYNADYHNYDDCNALSQLRGLG